MLNFAILSAGNIARRMARTLDSLREEVQPYAIAARDRAGAFFPYGNTRARLWQAVRRLEPHPRPCYNTLNTERTV